jgi:hypothetical protein
MFTIREIVEGVRPLADRFFGTTCTVWGRGPSMVSITAGVWGTTVLVNERSTPESVFTDILGKFSEWVNELP